MSDDSNPTSGGNFFDKAVNVFSNYATGGFAGYKDGKLDKNSGVVTNSATEAIGDVTGRNAARKAGFEAKDAADQEALQKAADLKQQAAAKEQQDRTASNYAGTVRASAAQKDNTVLGNVTSDFLGV